MVWLEKTLIEEEKNNYHPHGTYQPWGNVVWDGYDAILTESEFDNYYLDEDIQLGKVRWQEVYTRHSNFALTVGIKEIPEDVLEKEFRDAIQRCDVNKYYRDTCLDSVRKFKTKEGKIVLTWTECNHNPEWVMYEVSNKIHRMMLGLFDKYCPKKGKKRGSN